MCLTGEVSESVADHTGGLQQTGVWLLKVKAVAVEVVEEEEVKSEI